VKNRVLIGLIILMAIVGYVYLTKEELGSKIIWGRWQKGV
jgi:hypothetical protein